MLFIPQKPYLPLGDLRRAVSYPLDPRPVAEVVAALNLVGLPHLTQRLDERQNWSLQLSPGEQQRLAAARAILVRPEWLFLDEATSAMDAHTESQVYRVLKEQLPGTTLVSIGHRQSLVPFHRRYFVLDRYGAVTAGGAGAAGGVVTAGSAATGSAAGLLREEPMPAALAGAG